MIELSPISLVFVTILLLAAVSDARRFLIPNIYPAAMIVLFVAANVADFQFDDVLWSHLAHFGIALAVGLGLFYLRWFGGGDVKLYAAIAIWFGISHALLLLVMTTVTGATIVVLRMTWFAANTLLGGDSGGRRKTKLFERRIAYGIPIAVGGISSFFLVY